MGHQGQADKVRMREWQKELTVYNCENVENANDSLGKIYTEWV